MFLSRVWVEGKIVERDSSMDGWIKMYRKIEDNPVVCKDNDYYRVWHHLLYNATHQERVVIFNNQKMTIYPGQYITGRKLIADKCNVSESKVERILKWFENDQQIEQQKTSKGRLITILKWELYQNTEQQNEQIVGNTRAILEQRTITNKNVKNVRNNNSSSNIYDFVEQNLGRTLSSIEYEELSTWNDNELTRYAIKKAFSNGKYTLGYVKGILNNYRKNNITTIQQAQVEEENFKLKRDKTKITKKASNKGSSWELLEKWKKECENEENEKDRSD